MKKQSNYFVEEREIDVRKALTYAMRCWRFIVIMAILVAGVTVTVKYRSDVKTATENAVAAASAANADPVTVESLEAQMSTYEIQRVYSAVYMTEMLEEQREYQKKSILMAIDPYAKSTVEMVYSLEATEYAWTAIQEYLQYIDKEQFLNAVLEELGSSMESQYLKELIQTEALADGTGFKISVCAESQESCERLADAIETVIQEYMNIRVAENTAWNVTLSSRTYAVVVDSNLALTQMSVKWSLMNYVVNNSSMQTSFNATEKQLFNLKRETGLMPEEGILVEEEEVAEQRELVEPEDVHVSVRWSSLFLGAIAGILIALACAMIKYILSRAIHGGEELKYLFDVHVIGQINLVQMRPNRIGKKLDCKLATIGNGKLGKMDYAVQMEMLYSKILLLCREKNINCIYMSGSRMERIPTEFFEQLAEKLAKENIRLETGENVCYQFETLLQAVNIGNNVLIEIDEKSNCEEIARELNECKENEIKILGVVLVQV